MKILFWILIAGNLAVLGLFFLLGLAAAPSSRTSSLAVAAFMLVIPGLLLAASIWLFVAAESKLWRGVGMLLAAAPMLVLLIGNAVTDLTMSRHRDAQGNFTQFPRGPMQELELAIIRNDAAAVATLAQNWPAVLLLLERGADWRQLRSLDGRDFRAMLAHDASMHGEQPGLAEVTRFLDQATSPQSPR
jgi:hypothetical protein